ncbi:MAG: Flp pilus assembly complex ATPase component TadA, partial [Sandaracinaceae bacterium]|nr:Flp pilus assembly complex ATPase component TadA [Sandaracinaceae bacterium]
DAVLVGEMRDLETISAALSISETGHLVFATLHTNGAIQSINRIVDVFPAHQQPQVRAQLSFVLQGVLSQILLPRGDGPGRALALEVLVPNAAVRNLIREDKVHQLYSAMQTGQRDSGMQTLNQSLYDLVLRRLVAQEEALGRSPDPAELSSMIQNRAPLAGGRRPA